MVMPEAPAPTATVVEAGADGASAAVAVAAAPTSGDPRRRSGRPLVVRVVLGLLRALPVVALVLAVAATLALAIGPRIGAYRTITILSGSMEPAFAPGDVVISTKLPARDVRRGDVITFHAPVEGAPLVTHRVTRVVEGGEQPVVRTKGDANRSGDPWAARIEQDVVWRQRAVVPNLGHVIHALRHPSIQRIVLYGSLTVFLLVGLGTIWRRPEPSRGRT